MTSAPMTIRVGDKVRELRTGREAVVSAVRRQPARDGYEATEVAEWRTPADLHHPATTHLYVAAYVTDRRSGWGLVGNVAATDRRARETFGQSLRSEEWAVRANGLMCRIRRLRLEAFKATEDGRPATAARHTADADAHQATYDRHLRSVQ